MVMGYYYIAPIHVYNYNNIQLILLYTYMYINVCNIDQTYTCIFYEWWFVYMYMGKWRYMWL